MVVPVPHVLPDAVKVPLLQPVGLGEVEAEAVMVAEPDTVLVVVGV